MTDEITPNTLLEIRDAAKECSERGLTVAAKWATDILLSISANKKRILQLGIDEAAGAFSTSTPAKTRSPPPEPFPETSPISTQPLTQPAGPIVPARHPDAPKPQALTAADIKFENDRLRSEQDLLMGAKAFFDAREFRRVMFMLQGCRSSKAVFLSTYSLFLATERQALVDWHKLDSNRHQPPLPINTALTALLARVAESKDPWLLFLKALFLSRLTRREEAIEAALQSIASYPWNWSTWALLSSCINDGEELSALLPLIPLPPTNPVVQFFLVKTMNELQSSSETELAICDRLLSEEYFPHSMWAMSLRAAVLYHIHEYDQAESQFEKILQIDPYRIDDIDVFSNILYVQDNKLKLSRLAHEFLSLDKDRPEVCCLVGNHYSLRQEHEKAVKYFRRATQLDRTYLTAWTLMGHEYVEMKNSHAAIEAYRRAVDVNRKDYRAWYGLGQAYELLSMHHYALYYYQHATALRSYDVRLWQAQGSCYEEVGRPREAIECYKRALISSEAHETTLCLKLARMHGILNEQTEAFAYHRRVVEVCQANHRPVPEYAKSSVAVAEYHMNIPDGDLLLAREHLEQVAASNAEDVAKASELLKVVKARIQQKEKEAAQADAQARAAASADAMTE